MHKGHKWIAANELKKNFHCSNCGLDKDEHQDEIYRIPHLVRREVGYSSGKKYH